MKRLRFTLGLMLSFLLMGASVSVNAQSAGLSATLIAMGVTDTDGDGIISSSEFSLWTQPTTLTIPAATAPNLTNDSISELISLMPGITSIDVSTCTNTGFTTLDVSGKTALTGVGTLPANLKTLNISGCTGITSLTPSAGLTSLNVSGSGLASLSSLGTSLTTLDASNCSALTSLDCSGATVLETLNVTGSNALATLDISNTQVKNLDLSGKTVLTALTLNAVIETLDVSGCTLLTSLTPSASLTSLNVSGSGLTSLSGLGTSLTTLDASNCSALATLDCSGATALETLNVSGSDLSISLDISNTKVKNLDLSGNTTLASLTLNTVIETLDLSGCTTFNPTGFVIPASVESLDITDCAALTNLDISACKETLLKDKSYSISGCTSLSALKVSNNLENLTIKKGCVPTFVPTSIPATLKTVSIDVASDASAKYLTINTDPTNYKNLESLTVSGSVTSVNCQGSTSTVWDDRKLTSLNVSGCKEMTTLLCQSNKLTSLDVSGCTSLAIATFNCSDNRISSIDISDTPMNINASNAINFKQQNAEDGEPMDISIINNSNPKVNGFGGGVDFIKDLTNAKTYNITYKTNLDVDAYLIDKAIPGYKVKIGRDAVPGYILQSLKAYKTSDASKTDISSDNKFEMPAADVTVECVFVPNVNAKTFNIDWAIIDVDNDNLIVSSKGNEVDGFAIIVPGSAVEGSEITFSIRSNYTYKIDAISVEVLYSGYGDSDEFHAVSFTDLNDGGVSDGSDKTGGSYKFRMPIGNVKITLRVNDSSKPGLPTLPDPTVPHGVQIISNGLQTSPGAANGSNGYHYVAGNQNFTFTVYSVKPINVKTNRGNDEEGVIIEDNGNGSWKVTIRRVSTNLVVTVTEVTTESGTGENGTTGNEAIAKDAVWAANGTLYVKTTTPGTMAIYNVTGQLCKQVAVSGDATFTLSRGIYIVQLNGKAYKVVL